MNGPATSYAPLISLVVIAIILAFRMRRLALPRPLRTQWLWVVPGVLLAVTVTALVFAPPAGLDWVWLAGALAIGGVLGWYRGKTMRITVDPQTHALMASASPAAIAFVIALVAVRYGLRYVAMDGMIGAHVSTTLVTDVLMAFGLGLLGVQRLEMWLRSRRLVSQARAAPPGEPAS